MRTFIIISLVLLIHAATGTVELQKLTEKVASGLKTLKGIKETAKAKIHKLASDIDLHKLHQLDVLNIFPAPHHIGHPHHIHKVHPIPPIHPVHPIHPPKLFVPHIKKEPFVVDPHQVDRLKHYFEHEREHIHVHHFDH